MANAVSRVVPSEREEFARMMHSQARGASVPQDSRGVRDAIHQNQIDIPLAMRTKSGP